MPSVPRKTSFKLMPAAKETSLIFIPPSKPTIAADSDSPKSIDSSDNGRQNGGHPEVLEEIQENSAADRHLASAASTTSSIVSSKSRGSMGRSSPYDKVKWALEKDERWAKEIALGKRVGFYRLKGDLGSGNFSQVKLATHQLTKEKVAIKILDKSKLDNKTQLMLNREISIMEQLCHPNVIQLFEVIHSIAKVHLILEYANGGDLFAKINNNGRMGEQQAKLIFAQIVSAVDYMHSRNVIHRDLKSENVFFSNPERVKVGDFGFSTTIRCVDEALQTFCGSPPYAAPELFRDDSYIGTPVDVWALGVLLYFIVCGVMPFQAPTVAQLKRSILESDFEIPSHVTMDCAALIRGILRKSFRERYTMALVVDSGWLRSSMGALGPSAARRKWGQRIASSKGTLSRHTYHPWPRLTAEARDPLEVEVRKRMKRFGIDEEMIKEAMKDGCHNDVIGTYRILLDATNTEMKAKQEQSKMDAGKVPEKVGVPGNKSVAKNGPGLTRQATKSRTCAII